MIALLTLHLHLPGCASLKEKRSRIKPLINGLHGEFNLSVAEIGGQDHWQFSIIGCVMIGGNKAFLDGAMQKVIQWVEAHWTDADVMEEHLEFI